MYTISRGIYLALVIAGAFALIRLLGVTNVFFKDAAHIYIGGLFGAAIVLWSLPQFTNLKYILSSIQGYSDSQAEALLRMIERRLHAQANFYLALGVILTVIETLVAIISRLL